MSFPRKNLNDYQVSGGSHRWSAEPWECILLQDTNDSLPHLALCFLASEVTLGHEPISLKWLTKGPHTPMQFNPCRTCLVVEVFDLPY